MIIHHTEIDPTTITRLRIVHRDGELDLCGVHAVEALRAIRRVAPRGGKVGRPAVELRPVVRSALSPSAMLLGEIAERAGLSVDATRRTIGQLVADGEVVEGPAIPQRRGAPLKTYKLVT